MSCAGSTPAATATVAAVTAVAVVTAAAAATGTAVAARGTGRRRARPVVRDGPLPCTTERQMIYNSVLFIHYLLALMSFKLVFSLEHQTTLNPVVETFFNISSFVFHEERAIYSTSFE